MRGVRFTILKELELCVSRRIRDINENKIFNGIQSLPHRWKSCIAKEGKGYNVIFVY